MIRTVTLNTGFDEIYRVSGVAFGGVGEVTQHRAVASGKGINASRVMRALGAEVVAYGLVGELDIVAFSASLAADGVIARLIPVTGRTRRNLTLWPSEATQPAAHFRAAGFTLEDDRPIVRLMEVLSADLQAGDLVSLHGSTPAGIATDTWSRFGTLAMESDADLVIDVYGKALVEILETCRVVACKPNEEELRVLPGTGDLPNYEAACAALRYMRQRGVLLPTVSLGKEGMIFVIDDTVHTARCDVRRPQVIVGAGDACVAGLVVALITDGTVPTDAVVAAVAVASAHVAGTEQSNLRDSANRLVRDVQIESLGPL